MYCPKCGTENDHAARFCGKCGQELTTATGTALPELGELTEFDLVRQELESEYEILEELGRGGMAVVFRARERELDREVAIKVLPFSLAFDKEFVERFQREAKTSAKLEHPNIIPIYRVGRSGRVIYFVMKFLRGQPLSAQLAARGALPPGEIRRVLIEVGGALAYAHRKDIVHRDIKPDNIMFDEHGQAVVTDFGIAKAVSGGKLTGTGMAIGTPHYMSPEQARAQPLNGRSDIYSLGVVAYQCLTGQLPFDGEDSFSIGYKHIMEELPVPPLDSAEKRELFEIIKKMMAKQPDERFQSADRLVELLESGSPYVASGISTTPARVMPGASGPPSATQRQRIAAAATTPVPGISGRTTVRPKPRRSVMGGVLFWVFVVGSALGGAGYFAYSEGLLRLIMPPSHSDSSTTAAHDTGDAARQTDTTPTEPASSDTTRAAPALPPPGTPGHLSLQNVPQGARITINGQPVRGTQLDLPPGTHQLVVRATGYHPYERQVLITPGNPSTVRVELELVGQVTTRGPCDDYGPEYNRNNLCFDTRPTPLSATVIPVAADAPIFPRQAILLIHVSREGATVEARIFGPSNVDTFNTQALDMARALRWNPAIKDGLPTDAWVQWPFRPIR